jgi:D-amino-acid dehydrogenase
MTKKHIVITGGGIIGLAIADAAVRRGHRVTILERSARPGESCALGSAGMIVPSHFIPLAAPGAVALALRWMWNPESPLYIRPRLSSDLLAWGWRFLRAANAKHVERSAPLLRDLQLASRASFEEWPSRFGDAFGLTTKGLLMLCRSEHGLHEEAKTADIARSLGIPAEVLTPSQTATLEPAMRFDIAGSVYYPRDCHLVPERLVAALIRSVEDAGVEIAWETAPKRWRVTGDRVTAVETGDRTLEADEFVLAAGVWSSDIAEQLGVEVPMQAGKGYSLTLTAPPRLPQICAILTETRVAVTPMGSSLRVGGTMEIVATPDGTDPLVNPARVRGITRAMTEYCPEFTSDHFRDIPVWSGLRPCSPDGLPYVGRFARYTNLSAATGHGMMGVSLAPITGTLMAEILSDEAPSMDIGALSPDRFNRGQTFLLASSRSAP